MLTKKNNFILLILVWIFNLMVVLDVLNYIEFSGIILYPFGLAGFTYIFLLKAKPSKIGRKLFVSSLLSVAIMFTLVAIGIYVGH